MYNACNVQCTMYNVQCTVLGGLTGWGLDIGGCTEHTTDACLADALVALLG